MDTHKLQNHNTPNYQVDSSEFRSILDATKDLSLRLHVNVAPCNEAFKDRYPKFSHKRYDMEDTLQGVWRDSSSYIRPKSSIFPLHDIAVALHHFRNKEGKN